MLESGKCFTLNDISVRVHHASEGREVFQVFQGRSVTPYSPLLVRLSLTSISGCQERGGRRFNLFVTFGRILKQNSAAMVVRVPGISLLFPFPGGNIDVTDFRYANSVALHSRARALLFVFPRDPPCHHSPKLMNISR